MADVQIENGYTKIANELLEAIFSTDFSEPQQRILSFIIRYSYGCNKHSISLKHWNELAAAGIPSSKVRQYINILKEARVLFVDDDIITFMINKDYDQWRVSPVPGYSSALTQKVLKYNMKVNHSAIIRQTNKLTDSQYSSPTDIKFPTDSKQVSSPQSTPTNDKVKNDAGLQAPKESIKDNISNNDEKHQKVILLLKGCCANIGMNLNPKKVNQIVDIEKHPLERIEEVIENAKLNGIREYGFLGYVLTGLTDYDRLYGKKNDNNYINEPRYKNTQFTSRRNFFTDICSEAEARNRANGEQTNHTYTEEFWAYIDQIDDNKIPREKIVEAFIESNRNDLRASEKRGKFILNYLGVTK